MDDRADSCTRPTLLGRLRQVPDDPAAWREFVLRYGPKILGWCRTWCLQEADVQDVTQEVLLRLTRLMRTFVYDPVGSFRGYLRTLTQHALHDFVTSRGPDRGSGDEAVLDRLHQLAARDDLVRRLEGEFDLELLEEASRRVRLHVAPHTWEAFRLVALQGEPVAAVALRLGMKQAMVYAARHRVQARLQSELAEMEGTRDGP